MGGREGRARRSAAALLSCLACGARDLPPFPAEHDATTKSSDLGGPPPPGGMYGSCAWADGCAHLGAGPDYCVRPEGDLGFCTVECDPPGEPGSCEEPPSGTARLTCILVGSPEVSLCALDCAGDVACPESMECVDVRIDDRERRVCF